MSDKVIRVGGSHIGNSDSIFNLQQFLHNNKGRKFVVVSAIPDLLDFIQINIENIFQAEFDAHFIKNKLFEIYAEKLKQQASAAYESLTVKLISLLKGIALTGDYSSSLKDQVLSFSEKLSVELLRSQWNGNGHKSEVLWPENIELFATSDFGNATFLSLNRGKVNSLKNGVYLIPGSYGVTDNGKITRTGYTAADYTAAFLTRELGVEKLLLWDLDKHFLRADSGIIENPEVIKRLTYAEASELAYFEHYSFHPRTVEPLEHEHIPIQVLGSDSWDGKVETYINTETFIEDQIVKSVACTDDISLLKLDGPGVGLKPGILAKVTSRLNEAGINIKSVITSQTSINFILNRETAKKALDLMHELGFSAVTEISVVKDISLIGVVGHGMQRAYGVSAKIFSAVASNKINILLSGSGASDLVSYLIVNKEDKEKSVREIYKAFFNPS